MNDLLVMKQWIDNPNRDFSTGHALFLKYRVGSTYDDFFAKSAFKPDATALNMLFQKVSMIYHKLKSNPKFLESVISNQIQDQKPIGSNPTPPRKVVINDGKSKVTVRDPKILDSLPQELQSAGAIIKELTPLIGGLKAKLNALPADEQDEAKALVQELHKLDTEKRNLWKQIDEFTSTSGKDITTVKKVALTPSQLKDKIKGCKDSIRRIENKLPDQRKNRPALAKKSEKALVKKQKELEELENQLDANS